MELEKQQLSQFLSNYITSPMANYITSSRILLIIPILLLASNQDSIYNWISLGLFVTAGITDHLDGYIARKTGTSSPIGALLDLIADKLLICLTLIWLLYNTASLTFFIPSIIIISRELIISSLRQFFAEEKGLNPIKISFLAKSKTTFQIIATSFWLISPNFGYSFKIITLILLWIAAYLSVYSLYDYLKSYQKITR